MRAKAALVIASIILSVALLELGLRFYLAQFGDERQKVLYLYSSEEIQQLPKVFRGLAYLNFGLSPNFRDQNSLGYRGPEVALPKPPGIFRIVALGGSTTYGISLPSWAAAYPHQLQTALRDDYGYGNIEVINAGVPLYSSWESAVNALLRIADLQPDMIVIYHGINDLLARLIDPAFYVGSNPGRGFWIDRAPPMPFSSLQRLVMTRLGIDLSVSDQLQQTFQTPRGFRACKPANSAIEGMCADLDMSVRELLAVNEPVYFERNLRNMILLAEGMGSAVFLVSWAYSPLEYDVPRGSSMARDYMQAGIAEQNAIVRRLAEEHGALFYDLAATMPIDKPLWIDDLHMSAAGTSEMARQLAAYLDASAGHLFENESS